MIRIVVASALLGGCIIPIALPSARVEGGVAMAPHEDARKTLRAGAHVVGNRLAEDATWDVGAGYVATESGGMTPSTQGGYLEASYLHRVGERARFGFGPGVQLVKGSVWDPIVYLRGSFELYKPVQEAGTGDGNCGAVTGAWYGQLGFGTYVDVQAPLDQRGGIAVIAGLTLRLPAFFGVAFVVPGCK